MSQAPLLLLIRHAETEWSLSGRHTGLTDIPLTERGRATARALGDRLDGRSFFRVVSSPLSRALETCRLAGCGANVEPRDELLEWDYGEYEGLTTAQIRERRPTWNLWRDGAPGGESPAEVGARVDRLLDELREPAGDVALFAHGHLLRVLGARWIGLDPAGGGLLALSTGSISRLGHEHERAVLWGWNEAVGGG